MSEISEHRRNLAWMAGAKAARSGKSREANNREPGTIYFDDWCDGYDETAMKAQPVTTPTELVERLTRPIIGIENRTPQEAFDIMADRIHHALKADRIQTLEAALAAEREARARKDELLRYARAAVGDAMIVLAHSDPKVAAKAKQSLQEWISASFATERGPAPPAIRARSIQDRVG